MRVRTMLGALGERPFRLLWLAHTTSRLGDGLMPLALAFAVLELSHSGFALAFLILTDAAALWHFLFISAVMGASSAFFRPASTGLVPQTVSAARLQQANALMSLSRSAITVFGPVASGALVAAAGTGWVFAINGATYLASALFLAALRVRPAGRAAR